MKRAAGEKPSRRESLAAILIACVCALAAPAKAAGRDAGARTSPPRQTQTASRQSEPAEVQELRAGSPIRQELQGGQTRAYGVELSAGQYLEVSVRQEGIDVAARAYGPDGKKIAEVDNDPVDGTEYVVALAEAAGRSLMRRGRLALTGEP